MDNKTIFLTIENNGGWITLNRPQAMNALSDYMLKSLESTLREWKSLPEVHYVVIRGVGNALSTGADLKGLVSNSGEELFNHVKIAYKIISHIHNFSKPYISILDGIAMGGGMAYSISGTIRVLTENSKLSMPEVGVGFFPDAGSSYFFNRCPGKIGLYLALTGKIIGSHDAMFTGLGTHYIHSLEIENLMTDIKNANGKSLIDVLQRYDRPIHGDAPLQIHQDIIDHCFNQPSIEKIFQALSLHESEFAAKTLANLKTVSPLSLRKTFDIYKAAENMTMDEVIADNLTRFLEWITTPETQQEMQEGVRAMLIDKDRNPKWPSPPIEY